MRNVEEYLLHGNIFSIYQVIKQVSRNINHFCKNKNNVYVKNGQEVYRTKCYK